MERLLKASLVALFLISESASAESWVYDSQAHFRLGSLSASYSGGTTSSTGAFSVSNTIDLEYEMFSSSRRSFAFRTIIAHDLSTSRLMYAYIGLGPRLYVGSSGSAFHVTEKGSEFKSVPKWRYYVGLDAGVSQVVIVTFGPVLQSSSAMFDVGGQAGTIYQISKSFGIEAHLGYTMGFGFSSVAASGSTMRMFLGGVLYL